MGFLASGAFWGSLLILWGLSLIMGTVFHVHIPFFRIAFALIVIWIGIRLLTGGSSICRTDRAVVFSEAEFPAGKPQKHYEVVFGEGKVDLTAADMTKSPISVNVVFGSARVKVGPKQAVRIVASTAFGHVALPDGGTAAMGTSTWESKTAKGKGGVLEVRLSAVFGNIEVVTE
jgi:predicted membrane protein